MEEKDVEVEKLVSRAVQELYAYILEHKDIIRFGETQYTIERLKNEAGAQIGYNLTFQLTDHGIQDIEVHLNDGEFNIRGKVVEKGQYPFPTMILVSLLTGILTKWLSGIPDSEAFPTQPVGAVALTSAEGT